MDKQALNAALTRYEKVRASAWAEYEKVRASAWTEYEKVRASAWAEYEKVERSARSEYRKVRASARTEYEKVRASAGSEYRKVLAPAWSQIAEESLNPLVSWIVQNASDHQEQALLVLRSLPASLSELDDLAEGNGWCGAWEDLRSRAIEAGVVSE